MQTLGGLWRLPRIPHDTVIQQQSRSIGNTQYRVSTQLLNDLIRILILEILIRRKHILSIALWRLCEINLLYEFLREIQVLARVEKHTNSSCLIICLQRDQDGLVEILYDHLGIAGWLLLRNHGASACLLPTGVVAHTCRRWIHVLAHMLVVVTHLVLIQKLFHRICLALTHVHECREIDASADGKCRVVR